MWTLETLWTFAATFLDQDGHKPGPTYMLPFNRLEDLVRFMYDGEGQKEGQQEEIWVRIVSACYFQNNFLEHTLWRPRNECIEYAISQSTKKKILQAPQRNGAVLRTVPMSVNLIAPSKVQGCVLTRYIYIILAALSLSISKPIISFSFFWKIRRIHVISPTLDHIPAMIVVLKLQFVMFEMLEDVAQEHRGRGNQIFEPSTLWDAFKHMWWCQHRFDLDLMPYFQWSGSSRSFMAFQRTSNSCRFAKTRPGSEPPYVRDIQPIESLDRGLAWNFGIFPVSGWSHIMQQLVSPWWRLLWKHARVSMAATMHVQEPLCQRHSLGTGAELVKN